MALYALKKRHSFVHFIVGFSWLFLFPFKDFFPVKDRVVGLELQIFVGGEVNAGIVVFVKSEVNHHLHLVP